MSNAPFDRPMGGRRARKPRGDWPRPGSPRVHCPADLPGDADGLICPSSTSAALRAAIDRTVCSELVYPSHAKMAESQDYNNGFNQDITDQEYQQDDQMNGGGDAPQDSGSAEAPGKDDERKLFVGGLSWETTDKELREHFGSYGEIESINVKTDPTTGRSRGFAFIVFSQSSTIDKVLQAGDHIINNKKVDPKKAKARHGKIFVGGLTSELSDDEIKNHFAQFGTIVDVEMPFDKTKNQRKGFCFITFESEQVVMELLKNPKQSISGKEVDVKKATPKPNEMGGMRGGRGGRGGRGRGRGGYGGQGWGNQGYGGYGYGQGYDGYGGGYDYYGGGYGGGYGGYGGYDYSGYNNYGGYGGSGGYGGKTGRGRSATRHQPY